MAYTLEEIKELKELGFSNEEILKLQSGEAKKKKKKSLKGENGIKMDKLEREADSIKTIEEVRSVIKYFEQTAKKDRTRNSKGRWNMYLISAIGFNTSLRVVDLRAIKKSDIVFMDGKLRPNTIIHESKTGKKKDINITGNPVIKKAATEFLKMWGNEIDYNDYLFRTRQGKSKTKEGSEKDTAYITDRNINYYLAQAKKELRFPEDFRLSQHTYRKTWGYISRVIFKTPIEKISQQLNHETIKTTFLYIGITKEENLKMQSDNIIG